VKKKAGRKKYILSRSIFSVLLAITILANCERGDMYQKKVLNNFSNQLEKTNLGDFTLTIYYISPFIFTRTPLSVDDLINRSHGCKIVVIGSELKKHIGLFNHFGTETLIPVENESCVDARLYYVFETKKGRKVFDVSMWGDDNSIFVNGIEIKENDIFYDVVMPFMPDDVVKDLKTYLGENTEAETKKYLTSQPKM
jgi:hypothetical protein